MASIEKRGDDQYRAVIKRRGLGRVSKTFTTRKDAKDWAKLVESELLRGVYVVRRDAERTTLRECIERYRRDVVPKLRGVGHESTLRRLDEAFGKMALSAITPAKVANYRDARLRVGRSASTVKKELAKLSVIYKLASREWGIGGAVNPLAGVARPVEHNARTRRLAPGEEGKLLAACEPPMALLVRAALETAARLGELLAVEWGDVDTSKRVMTLRGIGGHGTKNGDPTRAVPLSSEALAVLRELGKLPRSMDSRLFWQWRASDSFSAAWRRVCTRAGIENLHFHDLRHEALSRLAERGDLSVLELAAISGHKTLAMLKRYTHLRSVDLARKLG